MAPGPILVIGGAGFLGSHLVDRLLDDGHEVDVVDDLSSGALGHLAAARARTSADGSRSLRFHHLDACAADLDPLIAMRHPAVVVHLGWAPPGLRTTAALARSVHSVLTVLEAARRHGVGKVVTVVPAGPLYGEVPLRDQPVREARTLAPTSAVGVVAKAIVDLLVVYRERHEVEFTALAMSGVYGPRQRPDGGVVATFVDAALHGRVPSVPGDGRQGRDLLFVDDAVDALRRAIERGSGLIVNVGSGTSVSLRDVWGQVAGADAPALGSTGADASASGRFVLATTRAKIHLGWEPWTSLGDGVALTVAAARDALGDGSSPG